MERFTIGCVLALSCFALTSATAQTTLRFPLKDGIASCGAPCTPETAPISSVFDHSMSGSGTYSLYSTPYGLDSKIVAYTSETGEKNFNDKSKDGKSATKEDCYAQDATGTEFQLNGHYQSLQELGASARRFLCYDNHPGIDYAVDKGTKVYAAMSGKVRYPDTMVGVRTGRRAFNKYHALELSSDLYKIYYLHLLTHPDTKPKELDQWCTSATVGGTVVPNGCEVTDDTGGACPSKVVLPLRPVAPSTEVKVQAGCLIALSGDAGAPAHLHFEVQEIVPITTVPASVQDKAWCPLDSSRACVPVDPYGWAPASPGPVDPYVALTGIAAERLWAGSGWTRVFPSNQPPSTGAAATGAATAYDAARQETVLFGGSPYISPGGVSFLDETWVWNGANWTRRSPLHSPPDRMFHSMVYDATRQEVVLFGGQGGSGSAFDDTWIWNGTDWILRSPIHKPPARTAHGMAYDATRGRTIVYGGASTLGYAADTWEWDGTDWHPMQLSGVAGARVYTAIAYDRVSQRVIMFGGGPGVLGGTFEWNGTTWSQRSPSSNPANRLGAKMATDPKSGRPLMFGGFTSDAAVPLGRLYDTWLWDGDNWMRQGDLVKNLTQTGDFVLSGDEARHNVVLYMPTEANQPGETWLWR